MYNRIITILHFFNLLIVLGLYKKISLLLRYSMKYFKVKRYNVCN